MKLFFRVILFLHLMIFNQNIYASNSVSKNMNLPWKVGEVVGKDWKIKKIKSHSEFIRISFAKGKKLTDVEVTYSRKKESSWSTKYYQIQPGPGSKPPKSLLIEILSSIKEIENREGHEPIVKEMSKNESYEKTGIRKSDYFFKDILGIFKKSIPYCIFIVSFIFSIYYIQKK